MLQTRPTSAQADTPAAGGGGPALFALRLMLVGLGLAAWFFTQHLIGSRPFAGMIGDGLLDALSPVHQYLQAHVGARDALLIASSAVIDLLGVYLLVRSIFGRTFRPFVGLLILFSLRQLCQAVCVLPTPPGMIWEYPGFPSLLVTYGVGNDLFFSGHTAIAVYGAIELVRAHRRLLWVGVAIALFEMMTVLSLRAHWTMDVYAGALSAALVAGLDRPVARVVDGVLGRITGGSRAR